MQRLTQLNVEVIKNNLPKEQNFDESDYEDLFGPNGGMWNLSDQYKNSFLLKPNFTNEDMNYSNILNLHQTTQILMER